MNPQTQWFSKILKNLKLMKDWLPGLEGLISQLGAKILELKALQL